MRLELAVSPSKDNVAAHELFWQVYVHAQEYEQSYFLIIHVQLHEKALWRTVIYLKNNFSKIRIITVDIIRGPGLRFTKVFMT